jgi:hypothetical protein
MKVTRRWLIISAVLSILLSGGMFIKLKAQNETQQMPGQCCFVHPNYNGVCIVEPAGDETCSSILEYLNTPNSVGKTYCGNTIIRSGWEQVKCQE